jgi:hypothetical protein
MKAATARGGLAITVDRFSGSLLGSVTAYVDITDGIVTSVRIDDSSFGCDPQSDVHDDVGNNGLAQADAIAEHVLAQTWPHWEFG